MQQALIGPAYFIFVIEKLARKQMPGYYINIENARDIAAGIPNAYVSSITAVSYDGGRTFRQICVAGESDQRINIIDEMKPVTV